MSVYTDITKHAEKIQAMMNQIKDVTHLEPPRKWARFDWKIKCIWMVLLKKFLLIRLLHKKMFINQLIIGVSTVVLNQNIWYWIIMQFSKLFPRGKGPTSTLRKTIWLNQRKLFLWKTFYDLKKWFIRIK